MKKIALFTLLACLPFYMLKAQDVELGTYRMNTYEKKVYCSKDLKDVFIEIGGDSEASRNIALEIAYKNLDGFRKCILEIKAKTLEWDSVATANNVTDITKDMYKSNFRYRIIWQGGNWYETNNKREITWQYIRQNSISYCYFYDNYRSSYSEYIDTPAGMLLKLDEIDKLLEILSEENIRRKMSDEQNKSDLFK